MASTGDEGSETDSEPHSDDALDVSPLSQSASVDDECSVDAFITPAAESQAECTPLDDGNTHLEDEEDDREGVFHGLDSTWRFYTENERALAASLDQQRANDLSIHLYNAHALKARVWEPTSSAPPKPYRRQNVKRNEDGSLSWHPDAEWTAWPLTPENVPRMNESFGVLFLGAERKVETYMNQEVWKPSTNLAGEIQALMLKKAKEQYRKRGSVRVARRPPLGVKRVKGKARQLSNADLASESELDADDSDSDNAQPRKAILSGRKRGVKPELIVDDDQASDLLQPAVRHILAKLDDMLIGLHKNREGQQLNKSRPRTKSRRSRSKSQTESASPSTRKPVKRSSSQVSEGVSDDLEMIDSGRDLEQGNDDELSQKDFKRRRPLNPRDWNEVLGVASLVGWDPVVVGRAAKRCASLFGESSVSGIIFDGGNATESRMLTHTSATEIAPDRSMEVTNPSVKDAKSVRHFCPFEGCPRHHDSYEKTWRWREHLKRSHHYTREQIENLEASLHEELEIELCGQRSGEGTTSMQAGHAQELSDAVHNGGFLQPIRAKMGRGKDIGTRKQKASKKRGVSHSR